MTVMWEARAEFLVRGDPSPLWFAYIERERLDVRALAQRDIAVIVTPCRFLEGRRFEFDGFGGASGAVIEVFDADAVSIIDLCAWPLSKPDAFATLLGRGAVLGADALVNPASWFGGQYLRAWRTPVEWLKANATGFVLLDTRNARSTFQRVGGDILTQDYAHTFAVWRASGLRKNSFIYDDGS